MLFEAIFVKLVELPGVGPAFFIVEGGMGGGVRYRVFELCYTALGNRLGGHGQFRKTILGGVGVMGKKGVLEWGNIPDKVPMDTE